MSGCAVVRGLVAHAWAQPWFVTAVVLLSVLTAILDGIASPVAAHFDVASGHSMAVFYELAFASTLLGCASTVVTLDGWAQPLKRLGSEFRLGVEVAVLGAMGATAMLPLLAVTWALGGLEAGQATGPSGPSAIATPPAPAWALGGLALLVVQRVALAACIQRVPGTVGLRLLLLVALGWWIPALVPPSFPLDLARWIRLPLDLATVGPTLATPEAWLADTAPLAGLFLAAWLGLPSTTGRR